MILNSTNVKKILAHLLFWANLAIIFVFWWTTSFWNLITGQSLSNPGYGAYLISIGRITGLIAVFLILIQLLAIGRVKWLEKSFGLDRLSIFHHRLGIIAFVLIIIHFISLLFGYANLGMMSLSEQLIDFLLHWESLIPTTIALVLFIIVTAGSITIVKRRLKYEFWYYVHLVAYLAILLAFGHQLELGYDLINSHLFSAYWILLYVFVGINFVVYRFLWQIYLLYKHQFYISKIVQETSDTFSIYIEGNNIEKFEFKAGQFLILRFLTKKLFLQAHPYSISSIPGKNYLRITVKKLGDFSGLTKDIPIGTKVLVDGPNGIFTRKTKQKDKVLLVAGGVGITPIRALIEELAKSHTNLVLLYSIRKSEQIIFKNELENLQNEYDNIKIHYVFSEEPNKHGFNLINEECILCLVPDVAMREAYICGPAGMMVAIKKYLINLKINKSNIYYEKFSL